MKINDCIVVTGASSGIGLSVVRRLLADGKNVVAADRNPPTITDMPSRTMENFLSVVCDLTSENGVETLVNKIKSRFSTVSGFVHCAGFVRTAPLSYILPDDASAMYSIHALFPLRFLGWLAKKANHSEKTACVLISSMACHEGDRGNAAYAAAKGAVEGMLKCAASELISKGIRINALVLGIIDTPLAHNSWMDSSSAEQLAAKKKQYPLGFGSPDNIAGIVDFFLSPLSDWVTGQTLVCDGGHSIC